MKLKFLLIFPMLLLVAAALSACAGGATIATSWPGLTVDEETAYLAYNRSVYAINLSNGIQKWIYPNEPDNSKAFYSDPALSPDGQLIVGGYDQILYSLNPDSGTLNWQFTQAEYRYIASQLANENGIFAPNSDKTVYALDASGGLRWEYLSEGESWAQPVSDPECECLYLTTMQHFVYALNPEDGSVIWESESLGGSIVGVPALSPDKVLYLGTFGSEVIALNGENGKIVWRVPTEGWVWSGPTLIDDRLYLGDLNGNFYALNATDGSTIWKVASSQLDGPITGSPLVDGDRIYFGTENGTLFAVDTSGKILWKQTVGGKLYPSPKLAGDLILVAPIQIDELLVAYSKDGARQWSFTPAK
jgi:outer membrane protein assembly factor BamB